MPHDSHTTHEPDRVGREGDVVIVETDITRQTTLPLIGGLDPLDRTGELAPATN